MAGGFTPEFMEELIYKCDIVEIISQYVPLQKKGGRYFGCCPFHNEKTPSFCVNQQDGYYHCFGCGASGNVIKFVMEMESIAFIDAVKLLAEKVGMQLPELKFDPKYAEKKERNDVLKQLMRDAARYYRSNLIDDKKGKEAREYLQNRSINEETAKRYGLGLSVDYDSMVAYMRRKGYKLKDLLDCGLISNVDRPSDAFANRIIVPILNGMSEVIAFGGRIYHGEKEVAKYKNSTNTILFDKGRTVYGINFIKRDKRYNGISYKDLILVEGYMDVISLGAFGIKNVIAGMGTALTEGQAREIARMTQNLYVCYDGDGAGRNATIKNIDTLANCGMDVRVISLADGKDPDETVRSEGYEGFIKRKEAALPVIEYKLKLCADANDLESVNGRAKYVQSALKVLKTVQNKAEREVYLNLVSKLSRVSVSTLTEEVGTLGSRAETKQKHNEEEKEERSIRASRFVINRIIDNANYVVYSQIKKEWLAHPVHQAIFNWASAQPVGEIKAGYVYNLIGYDEKELDNIFNVNLQFTNLAKEAEYYRDCISSLANEYITGRLKYLTTKFESMPPSEERQTVVAEIQRLQKSLKSKSIEDKL